MSAKTTTKSSIFLFVILLLALVISMILGYQSTVGKVTEGNTPMTTNQVFNIESKVVKQLGGKSMYVVYSTKTYVMFDAVDPATATYSVVVATDLDAASPTIITPDGKTVAALPAKWALSSQPTAWSFVHGNITVVFSGMNQIFNVHVLENGTHAAYLGTSFLAPSDIIVAKFPVTSVILDKEVVGSVNAKSMTPGESMPDTLLIAKNFSFEIEDEAISELLSGETAKSFTIGQSKHVLNDDPQFFVTTQDAIVIINTNISITPNKMQEIYTVLILDPKSYTVNNDIIFHLDKNITLPPTNGSTHGSTTTSNNTDITAVSMGNTDFIQSRGNDMVAYVPREMCLKYNSDGSCATLNGSQTALSDDTKKKDSQNTSSAPATDTKKTSTAVAAGPAANPNSLGGVSNNLINKSSDLAGKVTDNATGLAVGAGVLAAGAGSTAANLVSGAGSGAKDLLENTGSGAMSLAKGVGGEVSDVISGVGQGIAGVGNELAYLANTAVQGGVNAQGRQQLGGQAPLYSAINAVGPAYITGYGNNMSANDIPSIYNYYGSQTTGQQTTSTYLPYPDSFAAFTR
jgi:hypothetical protein